MISQRTDMHKTTHWQRGAARRGNAIVLAAGVLVLLVIIATAYITTTQTGRITGKAVERNAQFSTNADIVAEQIADEIAGALFVRPVDPNSAPATFDPNPPFDAETEAVSANVARLPAAQNATHTRYNIDEFSPRDLDGDGTLEPRLTYNFAPYQVVPFTNWPDENFNIPASNIVWPHGEEGNPSGVNIGTEGNPLGNPGYGDTRWLRDTEPLRMPFDLDGSGDWDLFDGEAFYLWRHLTNLSRPGNGWRIVKDIRDITDAVPEGSEDPGAAIPDGLVQDLNIPVEQWLPFAPTGTQGGVPDVPFYLLAETGSTPYDEVASDTFDFFQRWDDWMTSWQSYGFVYNQSNRVPPNFYKLNDLNADGATNDWEIGGVPQESPESEFIPGTARYNVSRVLADSDGDGFTDAFWHLVPTPEHDGIRLLAAVSIIDNSAMLNANVATAQDPYMSPPGNGVFEQFNVGRTTGATPADLALVGEDDGPVAPAATAQGAPTFWNTGFYDGHLNHQRRGFLSQWYYDNQRWERHVDEVGLPSGTGIYDSGLTALPNPEQWANLRLKYWQHAGNRPLNPLEDPAPDYGQYTPFTLQDELELRMYHGQNYPWIHSRYEWSVQAFSDNGALLRGAINTDPGAPDDPANPGVPMTGPTSIETSEYLDQLQNPELVYDPRRKLTMYSNTRNDLLPPWLRWRWQDVNDLDGDGTVQEPQPPDQVFNPADYYLDPASVCAAIAYSNREANFQQQSLRKLDLREATTVPVFSQDCGAQLLNHDEMLRNGFLPLSERLAPSLMLALTDGQFPYQTTPSNQFMRGYYDDGQPFADADSNSIDDDIDNTRHLAAGFAANILEYRDADQTARLEDAQPLPQFSDVATDFSTRYLGLEPQPFIVDAFIAHVYAAESFPDCPTCPTPVSPSPFPSGNYVTDQLDKTTVIAVQIANPFNQPIELLGDVNGDGSVESLYRLSVFGQEVDIADPNDTVPDVLPPANENRPSTAIYFAIEEGFDGLSGVDGWRAKWIDYLDIDVDNGDLAPGSFTFNVNGLIADTWSNDPEDYDQTSIGGDRSVELSRLDPSGNPSVGPWVVVDRMDYENSDHNNHEEFADAVIDMREDDDQAPPNQPILDCSSCSTPGSVEYFYMSDRDYYVTWARSTRAWGSDFNYDSTNPSTFGTQPRERSPRFVIARQHVTTSVDSVEDNDEHPSEVLAGSDTLGNPLAWEQGDVIEIDDPPDGNPATNTFAWFGYRYDNGVDINNNPIDNDNDGFSLDFRKATFFNLHAPYDQTGRAIYPPFNDAQFGYGNWHHNQVLPADFVGVPDKGFYIRNVNDTNIPPDDQDGQYALQMLNKAGDINDNDFSPSGGAGVNNDALADPDFTQVGEILNVFLYGHELAFTANAYDETVRTFSEYMDQEANDERAVGDDARVNRLRVRPTDLDDDGMDDASPILGDGTGDLNVDLRHAAPRLPAGLRVLDLFVLDGPGVNFDDLDGDGVVSDAEIDEQTDDPDELDYHWNKSFDLAGGFQGRPTHGLINVNTATPEVMSAMPHMHRMVFADPDFYVDESSFHRVPFVRVPRALQAYREQNQAYDPVNQIDPSAASWSGWSLGGGVIPGPSYTNRNTLVEGGLRGERGIASVGEPLLLRKPGSIDPIYPPANFDAASQSRTDQSWRIDFPAWSIETFANTSNAINNLRLSLAPDGEPFRERVSAHISTDLDDRLNTSLTNDPTAIDQTAHDAQEQTLLYSGLSNLITTRSDTFTVYMKIRAVQQDPQTGRWNALDKDSIVSEARYVMLVDRSNVNKPSDKPRILYFEKLPK